MTERDDLAAELDETVRRFGEAWASGDVATLEALLSPTYTHTDAFGDFHERAAWLDYARGRAGRATRIDFHGMQTRILGEVALVTGVNELQGDGVRNPTDRRGLRLRFVQIWVRKDGQWLREAFQATPCDGSSGAAR